MSDESDAESMLHEEFHEAARRDDAAELVRLAARGADVDWRDVQGRTVLHIAAARGSLDAIETALALGAAIDAPTQRGWVPLHFALYNRHCAAVRALVAHGASVRALAVDGRCALHCARVDSALHVLLLAGAGAQLTVRDAAGDSPLALCARSAPAAHREMLRYRAAPRRFRAAHAPLVQLAIALAPLDLPALVTTRLAAFAAAANERRIASYRPAAAWTLAALVKRRARRAIAERVKRDEPPFLIDNDIDNDLDNDNDNDKDFHNNNNNNNNNNALSLSADSQDNDSEESQESKESEESDSDDSQESIDSQSQHDSPHASPYACHDDDLRADSSATAADFPSAASGERAQRSAVMVAFSRLRAAPGRRAALRAFGGAPATSGVGVGAARQRAASDEALRDTFAKTMACLRRDSEPDSLGAFYGALDFARPLALDGAGVDLDPADVDADYDHERCHVFDESDDERFELIDVAALRRSAADAECDSASMDVSSDDLRRASGATLSSDDEPERCAKRRADASPLRAPAQTRSG